MSSFGKIEKLTEANGDIFIGDLSKSIYGAESTAIGEKYYGRLNDGARHGKGCLKKLNGNTYTGEFSYGFMNGFGQYIEGTTRIYIGELTKGKKFFKYFQAKEQVMEL